MSLHSCNIFLSGRNQGRRQLAPGHLFGSLKNKGRTVKNNFSFDPNILFIWTEHSLSIVSASALAFYHIFVISFFFSTNYFNFLIVILSLVCFLVICFHFSFESFHFWVISLLDPVIQQPSTILHYLFFFTNWKFLTPKN
jgi:hypothetical protein